MKKSFAKISSWISLTILGISNAEATTSREVFQKYLNHYFVETGSYCGDGIQMALEAGFKEVYSIELSDHYFRQCSQRFQGIAQVHLFHGDSSTSLSNLLRSIDMPATFWLDGHYSGGNTAKGNSNSPILAELNAIAKHPIKTHTILIDDIRQLGTADFDFITINQILAKIKSINPNYRIVFEDGYIANDVLVAYIE